MAHEFNVSGTKGVLRFVTNPWLRVAGRNHMLWYPYEGEVENIYVDDPRNAFYHQVKLVEAAITIGAKGAVQPSLRREDSLEITEFLTEWEGLARST